MARKTLFVSIVMMVVIVLPGFSLPFIKGSMQKEIEKSKTADEACRKIRNLIEARTKENLFGGNDEALLRKELKTKDNDGYLPIFAPVYNKDVELTRMILKYMDNNIDQLYAPDGCSLLQIAAADDSDRTAILELLLKSNPSQGYLDYSCNNDGWTALNTAVSRGNKRIAELLLDHNANPNIVEKEYNTTPLVQAIDSDTYKNLDDRFDLIKSLVEKGANVNYSWKISGAGVNYTPLFTAITYGYRDIAKFLMEKGADINAVNTYTNNEGSFCSATALAYVYATGNRDMANLLLDQQNININSDFISQQGDNIVNHVSPLFWAVVGSLEDDIKLLLEKGADINNAKNTYMYNMANNLHLYDASPLNYACFFGMNEIADLLMENDADVNIPMKWEDIGDDGNRIYCERPLLIHAYLSDNKSLFDSLIEHGADVNKQDAYGSTIMHYAASRGDYKTYTLMKGNGGNVAIKDNEGNSPLQVWLDYGTRTVADKFLICYEEMEQDSSASSKLEKLVSEIKLADINGRTSNDSKQTILQVVLANKDENTARTLIEKGADYKIADGDGDNALDYAIKKDLQRTVEFLAEKKDAISRNSVFNALEKRNEEAVILLLEHGADYTSRNGKGSNVLDCAIDLGLRGVVSYLAEKKDAMSKTVLIRALENEDQKSALLLLEKGADYKVNKGEEKAFDYAMTHNMQEVVSYLAEQPGALSNLSLFKAIDKDLKDNTNFVPQVLTAKDKPALSIYESRLSSTVSPVLYASISYPEEGTYPFERKKSVIDALKENGYSIDEKVSSGSQSGKTALFFAVEHDDYDFVKFLLESGADPSISQKGDYAGRTPLCYALERKNEAIISLLLEKLGENIADIKLSNQHDHNTTLLMLFARYGNSDNMKYALPKMIAKSSQCLDAKDTDGRTAFMYAAQYNENHRVMAILRMYGCDIFAKDKDGHTALDIATEADSPNVDRLKSYGL